jgi:hypothetical protein
MALPWLRILDALIGVTDLARSRRIRSLASAGEERAPAEVGPPGAGGLEARLAGVMVAALKEVFERDNRRLDLEREQLEAERRRAERAVELEMLRQAADREIGRLRWLAGVDVAAWLSSLVFAVRATGAGVTARVMLGSGWALLLAAIAASFSGQASVARSIERERAPSGDLGAVTLWLTVLGLALVTFSALM